jgi:pimeloyl-ACP methyl ester carboxylesterase
LDASRSPCGLDKLTGTVQVELVHTITSDGVPLDGYFRAASRPAADSALDLVICHHGVGSKFYTPSFFDAVGDALLGNGCAVLRVNNRGHDDAFLVGERPYGAAYEIIDECRADITAWLDYAQERGFKRIALWGHSLGAVKTIYFLSVQDDPRIVCAVASSPPRFAYELYGEGLHSVVRQAQALVDAGTPLETVQALLPVRRRFSARTYLDKYGPNARYDYMVHLPRIEKPILLTVGSLEADNVSFAGLVQNGPTFNTRWPNVDFRNIDGADHGYTDRSSELWSAVDGWLNRALSRQLTAR